MATISFNKTKNILNNNNRIKKKKNKIIKFDDKLKKESKKESSDNLLIPATEVSCVIKYFVFGFNVLFWVSCNF